MARSAYAELYKMIVYAGNKRCMNKNMNMTPSIVCYT